MFFLACQKTLLGFRYEGYVPFKRTMAPLKSRQTFFNARFFSCINYVHDVVQKDNFGAILSGFTALGGFRETPGGFLMVWTVAERAASLNIKAEEILTLQPCLSMQIPLFCVQSQRLSGSWDEFVMMCDWNKLWQGAF